MYLKNLKIWNFRCIGSKENNKPGLEVDFNSKLNLLIGPNDSGKTAIIDAVRYCLGTQTNDPIRIDDEDFYEENGLRKNEFRIECIFTGFNDKEAGQFLEWIDIKDPNDISKAELKIYLTAQRKNNRIITNIKAGIDEEGQSIYGEPKDLLHVTYLKPLRDAESELSPSNRSRLAQILKSHPIFNKNKEDEEHLLETYFKEANKKVTDFFNKDILDENIKGGKEIKDKFNEQTKSFLENTDKREPIIDITKTELNAILRKLELYLEKNKSGLGTLNQLYMAAELIHLKRENYIGLRLGLIEELEAHLHPQAQLRVLKSLIEDKNNNIQYILTTHSTTLGASIPLEYVKLCSEGKVYSLDKDNTQLSESDYQFLERFLDATKANLFFAKGVIIVEGDAENILIPALAEIIGKPLYKYGVSIVNVGSKALLRYANIFKRKDDSTLPIKVAIVTDIDLKINEDGQPYGSVNVIEQKQTIKQKYNSNDGNIKTFVSPLKTLEFDIALGDLYGYMHKAIQIAKKIKSKNGWISDKEVENILKTEDEILNEQDQNKRAYKIYEPLDKGQASKAVTAQWFAKLLLDDRDNVKNKINNDTNKNTGIKYLIEAINHVTEQNK